MNVRDSVGPNHENDRATSGNRILNMLMAGRSVSSGPKITTTLAAISYPSPIQQMEKERGPAFPRSNYAFRTLNHANKNSKMAGDKYPSPKISKKLACSTAVHRSHL